MYLDIEAIYVEAKSAAMRTGKSLFYDNVVSGIQKVQEDTKTCIVAQVKDISVNPVALHNVRITFDEQGGLYEYTCTCCGEAPGVEPCPHVVATALSYDDKFANVKSPTPVRHFRARARTDADIFLLSSEFAKRRIAANFENTKDVRLIPILGLTAQKKPYVRFCLQKNRRRYLVKDIQDFIYAYTKSDRRRFGVDLDFSVVRDNFDSHSANVMDFLTTAIHEKNRMLEEIAGADTNLKKHTIVSAFKESMPLFPREADDLFALVSGRLIEFEYSGLVGGMRSVEKEKDAMDIVFTLTAADEGYYVSTNFTEGHFIAGGQNNYYVTDSRLFCLSRQYCKNVLSLARSLSHRGKLFILAQDMPLFYNNVLLQVAKNATISAPDINLEQYKAAQFSAKLYLSAGSDVALQGHLSCYYDGNEVDIFDENFVGDMVRDVESERRLVETLERFFPSCPELSLADEGLLYLFLKEGTRRIGAYAEVVLDDTLSAFKLKKSPKLKVGVRLETGLLNLELQAEEYTDDEIKAILQAHKEKQSYIRLSDGSFVDLTAQHIQNLSDFLMRIGKPYQQKISLPQSYAFFLNDSFSEHDVDLELDNNFNALIRRLSGEEEMEIAVPNSLKNILRPYQKQGFSWLKTLADLEFGGILADDMGLGKSLQVLTLFLADEKRGKKIIICPTSLILNWVDECKKFVPEMGVQAIFGSGPERAGMIKAAIEDDKIELIITSYELLRRDVKLYESAQFDYAVLDEAQYIKNPTTHNARTVKELKAKRRYALSGTPIENTLSELWSIFDFIMPGYLLPYNRFKTEFENEIVKIGEEGPSKSGMAAVESFKKLVAPFILRRLKSEVLKDLPAKIETDSMVPLEGEQRKLYAANLADMQKRLRGEGEAAGNRIEILSMLMRLRQIACHPKLLYPEYAEPCAKFEAALELVKLSIEGGHRVLLFSQFTSMIEIFRERFGAEGITHYVLKGDTPKPMRNQMVHDFNTGETQVFLISLKAGGTGLNLTGADVVVHYDPWWNESVTSQATDRAHRIGQEKSVQVYKLFTKDSVEERILELTKKKSALSKLVLGTAGLQNLKADDLKNLILGG